jgi:hypothetical protein
MNLIRDLHMLMRFVLVFAVLLTSGAKLAAQPPTMRVRPTPQECRVWVNKLQSSTHSAAHRAALIDNRLSDCGEAGANALARALLQIGGTREPTGRGSLMFQASYSRHPAVLAAALQLAADREATPIARVVGLYVALRQHDITRALDGGLDRLTSAPVGRLCVPDYILHTGEHNFSAPLPTDYRERIRSVTTRIARDSTESSILRELAACVERGLVPAEPWDENP